MQPLQRLQQPTRTPLQPHGVADNQRRTLELYWRTGKQDGSKTPGGAMRGFKIVSGLAAVLAAGVAVIPRPARAQSDEVTFSKDIAPILQRSCQQCHRPDSIAPMSLLTYEDARP